MTPDAITLDFWNTLAKEGPGGLFAPRVARWATVLRESGFTVEDAELDRVHRSALAAYQEAWRGGVQFRSAEATNHALQALGLDCDASTVERLERCFVEAGEASDIVAVEGAVEGVRRLAGAGVRLAVICDIGLTPSDALEPLLARWGIAEHFDLLAWSDRTGVYKPEPDIFRHVLLRVGVDAERAWHVGDRRRTDVAGAAAAGMTAVRFRGVYDDEDDVPDAPIVVDSYAELLRAAGVT